MSNAMPSFFAEFLSEIRLTQTQKDNLKNGHKTLRKRLTECTSTKNFVITSLLQGSYRRATAVRPQGDDLADVDVIVVTNIDERTIAPIEVLQDFKPFLEEYYKGKYKFQNRSIGIKLSAIKLDLVPTTHPTGKLLEMINSEWLKNTSTLLDKGFDLSEVPEPLLIPDRLTEEWEPTNPLAQIIKTREKNDQCNGHFVNVVKALKWWRKVTCPKPKYPKSYPLEHLIWYNCPEDINSIAEGIVKTLENIVSNYHHFAVNKLTPDLPDHGVNQNVFARVTGKDFSAFFEHVKQASEVTRNAYESDDKCEKIRLWRSIFGSVFPSSEECEEDTDAREKFIPPIDVSEPKGGRYA